MRYKSILIIVRVLKIKYKRTTAKIKPNKTDEVHWGTAHL